MQIMQSPRTKAEESGLNEVGNREPQQILSNDDMLSVVFRRSSWQTQGRRDYKPGEAKRGKTEANSRLTSENTCQKYK